MMWDCEFQLYDHMLSRHPFHDYFMKICNDVLGRANNMVSRNVSASVEARMSGEMCTSLGNGFSNLMATLFVGTSLGNALDDIIGVVEGDDGLFRMTNAPGSQDYARLGWRVKLEATHELCMASFCGNVFDPVALQAVGDPAKYLPEFGWARRQYIDASPKIMLALLRCKSMSFMSQFPAAPIITALARYGLRCSSQISPLRVRKVAMNMKCSQYERDLLFSRLDSFEDRNEVIDIRTRMVCEQKFGYTIPEQYRIEHWLDTCTEIKPLPIWFGERCSLDCFDYFERYVRAKSMGESTPSIAYASVLSLVQAINLREAQSHVRQFKLGHWR
jgi:hypothetical protein